MDYSVEVRETPEQALLVAKGRAGVSELGDKIGALFAEVYEFIKRSEIEECGQNVIVYHDEVGKALLLTRRGVPLEVGVQIDGPIDEGKRVIRSATPGGKVARTVHTGPYQNLSLAHGAVREWCIANKHEIAGPNWEIYGDWTEDEAALTTEVIYLLK